ncbi:copper resistance CopC/CopD family protein [Streptomyces mirabilis]|uniref:copper resistance CopC/CopD family protein n=1 Tax=Streptomyces mirabilis TaxID=68239 RepID=UPI00381B6EE4
MVVLALLALVLLGGAAPASAHAVLRDSDPPAGTVLKAAPAQVTVTFDESVALVENSVRVLDPDNRPVTAGDPEHADGRGNTARVRLTGGLRRGTYTVGWRVVSADSHAVSGAFTFSVGKPSERAAEVAVRPAVDGTTGALYDLARYVAYSGLALLIGIAVFVLACWPTATAARVVRRPFAAGWWALVLSTLALLLLRGPYESGGGPGGAFDPALLGRTVGSRPGIALLVRLALALAVALLVKRGWDTWITDRRTLAAGGVLALGLTGTWAAADHASAGIQVPVAVLSTVLHLLAMSVWLGGLTALLTTLLRTPADEALPPAGVARFSRLALTAVAVLAATGVYQSWRGLGSWDALFTTSYGRILAFKVWAVLLMLAVASYSRRWTARLLDAPRPEPLLVTVGGAAEAPTQVSRRTDEPGSGACRRGLRTSVLAEVAVGMVVLVLTTVLTGSRPGRAATETVAAPPVPGQPTQLLSVIPFDTGTPAGRGKVQIVLEPGRVGRNTVQAVTYGPDGSLLTVPELRLTFTLAQQHVGPLDAKLVDERGYWGSGTLDIPLAGTWTMKATVRVSDIDQVTVSKTVKID